MLHQRHHKDVAARLDAAVVAVDRAPRLKGSLLRERWRACLRRRPSSSGRASGSSAGASSTARHGSADRSWPGHSASTSRVSRPSTAARALCRLVSIASPRRRWSCASARGDGAVA